MEGMERFLPAPLHCIYRGNYTMILNTISTLTLYPSFLDSNTETDHKVKPNSQPNSNTNLKCNPNHDPSLRLEGCGWIFYQRNLTLTLSLTLTLTLILNLTLTFLYTFTESVNVFQLSIILNVNFFRHLSFYRQVFCIILNK